VSRGVASIAGFLGLGLFCEIGQEAEGEEVKSKKGKVKRGEGKGKRLRAEDGPGAGRDAGWIGVFGLVGLGDWAGTGAVVRRIGFVLGLFFWGWRGGFLL